jgi:hypothetical protein
MSITTPFKLFNLVTNTINLTLVVNSFEVESLIISQNVIIHVLKTDYKLKFNQSSKNKEEIITSGNTLMYNKKLK